MKSLQATPGGRQMTFTNPCMSSEGVDSALITCLLFSSISSRSRQIPIPQWKKKLSPKRSIYDKNTQFWVSLFGIAFHEVSFLMLDK